VCICTCMYACMAGSFRESVTLCDPRNNNDDDDDVDRLSFVPVGQ